MSSRDSTLVTYGSPSMASQYSSEEAEKDARPKHPGGRPPDPVWDHFFATPLRSPECEDKNLDNEIREKYQEINRYPKYLPPIRTAILQLEKANCTMADCFIQLVRLISTIYHIPKERDTITFRNRYIEIVNNRWNELEAEPYMLAYILHPEYQGASLKKGVWTQTALYAGTLWQSIGYKDKLSAQTLISQIIKFREKQFLYKIGYDSQLMTPFICASCERIFSILGWFYGKKRQRLSLKNLESLTKIRHHNLFNAYKELSYSAKTKLKINCESDDDDDLVIPNHQVVVLVVNDIVDLNHQMFNQADNQYTSNKENNNSDIAMNDDHEFNLEKLIHDQDFE
ncbi:4363_t:CDS:2 [Gigaspora rosea]|nr:4363_t:CDS:2 [Gigaspora rosea]